MRLQPECKGLHNNETEKVNRGRNPLTNENHSLKPVRSAIRENIIQQHNYY